MLCQRCGQRPAVVQRTVIKNDEKTEEYLCEECVGQVLQFPISMEWPGNIEKLFASLTGLMSQEQQIPLSCPKCGMKYHDFLESGRFGCATCYEAFGPKLAPLFNKIHNATHSMGKIPGHRDDPSADPAAGLTYRLRQAVEREDYEKAAELRDAIRKLEARGSVPKEDEKEEKEDRR